MLAALIPAVLSYRQLLGEPQGEAVAKQKLAVAKINAGHEGPVRCELGGSRNEGTDNSIKDELWTLRSSYSSTCMWPDAQPYIRKASRVLEDVCPGGCRGASCLQHPSASRASVSSSN